MPLAEVPLWTVSQLDQTQYQQAVLLFMGLILFSMSATLTVYLLRGRRQRS